jgi:type VI secretion system protein ImpK
MTLSKASTASRRMASIQRLINPMVSAAAPLLNGVIQPMQIEQKTEAIKLREFFVQGIRDFEMQLKQSDYRMPAILAGKHLLCAFMDEMILVQPWAKTLGWQENSLSWQLAHTKLANQDFFSILDQATKLSAANLDILELGYVCLSLGFQGKYRYAKDGALKLTQIADDIYEVIRQHRGEHYRQLSISPYSLKPKMSLFNKLPSKRIVLMSAVIILIVIGWGYHHRLLYLKNSIKGAINALQVNIKDMRTHSSET